VACVGDSITLGDGATSGQATYPGVLQAMLGDRVLVGAFGHSGATMLGAGASDIPYAEQPEYRDATTFVSEAGSDARVAVIIMLGTNDSKPAIWDYPDRRERFESDLEKLIDHFADLPTHPTVYLATPLGTGEHPCCHIRGDILEHDITPIIQSVAKARGLPLIDTTPIARHPELLVDGVHPTDKGYEELARLVHEVLTAQPPKPQPGRPWWRRFAH
jgi:sialate O-acetylesterase